jgi:hypothetical protein
MNKLEKFTRKPGRAHFDALTHLLRYLHENSMYAVCFYSTISSSPLYRMLFSQNIQEKHLFFGFMDSSLIMDVVILTYMGGVIIAQTCATLLPYHQPRLSITNDV